MSDSFRLTLASLVAGLVAAPLLAHAGHVERVTASSPEAWAMRWFAAALVESGAGGPATLAPGNFELGVEALEIPHLSARQRTVGFDGTKTEDLNRTPLAARPEVSLGLPGGWIVTAGWIPPIELDGAKANVLTLSLGRSFRFGDRGRVALRAAAAHATVRGDFTCPAAAAAAGDDPIANPYGCDEPSHDEQRFDTVGLTAAFGWRLGTRSTSPELTLAAGSHRFDGTFHVDATYVGFQDTTHLTNKSWITTAAVGLAVPVGERARLDLAAHVAPLSVERHIGTGPLERRERDDLLQVRAGFAVRLP
ncbi:MAG: hypothetical protein IPJ17_16345 [Holophagales bacterium]|nr:MAG: hypothetical protein IPJ17_16345 [Holophagales bacterium]